MRISSINSDPDFKVMIMLKITINSNHMKESSKKLPKKKISANKLLKVESKPSKKEMKWLTAFKKVSKTFSINSIKEYQPRTNFKV